jgi:hypothetical protein
MDLYIRIVGKKLNTLDATLGKTFPKLVLAN